MSHEDGNGKPRDFGTIAVEFQGDRITVPEGMSYQEARTVLEKREIEDETEVNISENVNCFPLDGAVAFAKVLKRRFGWTNLVPRDMGFFGRSRPTLVGVETGYNETVQIPWGDCKVPKIEGTLTTSYTIVEGLPIFQIAGSVKRKHEHIVSEIAAEVRKVAKEESIYRGKAVRINLRDSDGDRINDYGPDFAPRFLDLESINVEEIVYSTHTGQMLQVNVFNPVQHTEKCRENNIPLKRGILLAGPFGTGKTLTADLLAKICVDKGWTFLYLEDARDLEIAVGFAELYAPCVLFAEDIDKATSGNRDANMDRLFNKMDGLEGKQREVMTVLTTNTIQNIHAGFLRPGRIDTIVEVTPPDAAAICRLVKLYGRNDSGECLVMATEDEIAASLKSIEGVNAAFIREVVERAKLAALATCKGDKLMISADDLKVAAETLRPHIRLLYPGLEESKFDQEDMEEIDPIQFAMDVFMEKGAEAILQKVVDPKVLHKIMIKKTGKRRPGPGGFSMN